MFWLGNGGESGYLFLRANNINGEVTLRSCRGKGAVAAKNGRGGLGKKIHIFYLMQNVVVYRV